MKIHFCKSRDIGGLIIRLFTFSRWNHVAIEVGGIVYESVTAGGVRSVPARSFPQLWNSTESVSVAVENPTLLLAFLKEQVGKPYDWAAIFALPFRKSWHARDKWFCSELVAEALIAGGSDAIPRIKSFRVTPRDLWIALPLKVAH
tara:strand:+ start:197 stop:634 length:438 start_codon:yes stop_codon:yes gene_type:complete